MLNDGKAVVPDDERWGMRLKLKYPYGAGFLLVVFMATLGA